MCQHCVDENTIKITRYEVKGKLPDPFIFDDGSRVKTKADWERRRKEMYKTAVELQYGTMPPKPEFLEVEPLYLGAVESYRIHTGTRAKPVVFTMYVKGADRENKRPVVIDGDMCFDYPFDKKYTSIFNDNGITVCLFNRCELAHDIDGRGIGHGQLYETYPEHTFGALGAWAWGYSRCVDALEKLGSVDLSCIAFTGHSRGGKTAALAGVLDERAAIVNPNETCAGSCSCYRVNVDAITEYGEEKGNEELSDLLRRFGFWMGPDMKQFVDNEDAMPFDAHYIKSLIAPRVLFVSEAASDIWGNPVGSWHTTMAAKEVYKFLDAEDNLLWYFRKGKHFHHHRDLEMLVNVIRHVKYGEDLNTCYSKTPFVQPELIFDWKAPAE